MNGVGFGILPLCPSWSEAVSGRSGGLAFCGVEGCVGDAGTGVTDCLAFLHVDDGAAASNPEKSITSREPSEALTSAMPSTLLEFVLAIRDLNRVFSPPRRGSGSEALGGGGDCIGIDRGATGRDFSHASLSGVFRLERGLFLGSARSGKSNIEGLGTFFDCSLLSNGDSCNSGLEVAKAVVVDER